MSASRAARLLRTPRTLCGPSAVVACAGLFSCGLPDQDPVFVLAPPFDAGALDASAQAPASQLDAAADESLMSFRALPLARTEPSALKPFVAVPPAPLFPLQVAPRFLPPLSGGTLAVSKTGWVIASDPDRDQLHVIDPSFAKVRSLTLTEGQEPGRVAIDAGRAFVVLRSAGLLLSVDLASASVVHSTPVCAAPRGVFVDAAEARILVACAGGDLVSVAADGSRVLAKQHVEPDLRDVGRDTLGIWVSQFRSATLLRLDAALQIKTRHRPADVDVESTQGTALRRFAPTLAWRTLTAPSGTPLMLHQRAQSSEVPQVVNTPTGFVSPYGVIPGAASSAVASNVFSFCDGAVVHTAISSFGTEALTPGPALPQAVVPLDLALSPNGKHVAAVAPGNLNQDVPFEQGSLAARQLFVLPTSKLTRAPFVPPQLGDRQGDCASWAAQPEHRFPGEAIALHFVDDNTLLVQVRNPAELHVLRMDARERFRLSAIVALSSIALRDTGHEVFHQNTRAGIACASCHGEGLDDGHTWNFQKVGLRRTQSLRGRVLSRAPFHWSGDQLNLDVLISDVYEVRMGAAKLAIDARAALGRWLNELPLVPAEPGDAAVVARGRALFESEEAACSSCHQGSQLGRADKVNVGTGDAVKVPSLRNVSLRLPLMHTGCADTLEKRFDLLCGGDRHGKTSHLSAEQMADLLAYLRSL